jgi:hypothetical protein
MNRDQYLAARHNIENMGLTPDNVTGALRFLDQRYESEGGTPVVASDASKVVAAAIAGASAREAQITKVTRESLREAALGHAPAITPELARELAEMAVDGDALNPFELLRNQPAVDPEAFAAAWDAQAAADVEDKATSLAAFRKLQAESPARDAAAADHARKVAENEALRRTLVDHGATWETAAERFPDVPAGPEMLEPTSLERANADLFKDA